MIKIIIYISGNINILYFLFDTNRNSVPYQSSRWYSTKENVAKYFGEDMSVQARVIILLKLQFATEGTLPRFVRLSENVEVDNTCSRDIRWC